MIICNGIRNRTMTTTISRCSARVFGVGVLFVLIGINCDYVWSAHLPFDVGNSRATNQGLYDESDQVVSLSASTLNYFVFNKTYATHLEFYNSYCGHCRRFAPIWKELAADLSPWGDLVTVAAVDCAMDENAAICREFDIMGYPTVRFFPPLCKNETKESEKERGTAVPIDTAEAMRTDLISRLRLVENPPVSWPQLEPLDILTSDNLFGTKTSSVQYGILLFDDYEAEENVQASIEAILDLLPIRQIVVRIVNTTEIENRVGVLKKPALVSVSRAMETELIEISAAVDSSKRRQLTGTIQKFLQNRGIRIPTVIPHVPAAPSAVSERIVTDIPEIIAAQQDEAIRERVKTMGDTVFQADLEQALKQVLHNEVPKTTSIVGEKRLALERFLTTVSRYFPFGDNGRSFLNNLRDYVLEQKTGELSGDDFQHKVTELETKWEPIYSSSRWIGCESRQKHLRGYPCGLWTLFHYMTIQASETEVSNDPLEVLQAMHGYIKYFFGCTECSQHFQEMATRNRIWNVSSKDNAVLWLWQAHNEVNVRLAGDLTEDKEHPKVQYPTEAMCTICRRNGGHHALVTGDEPIDWDKTEVFFYMKRVYGWQNVSRFGVDNESVLPPSLESIRSRRLLQYVFSDMDLRMGMLLYISCICMLAVAVKLFLKRGYRKKMYVHDLLGKV